MKKKQKKTVREGEVAEKANETGMSDLKKFIEKQQLQNKILQKLIDDLQSVDIDNINTPKSA